MFFSHSSEQIDFTTEINIILASTELYFQQGKKFQHERIWSAKGQFVHHAL